MGSTMDDLIRKRDEEDEEIMFLSTCPVPFN
jgi:hypothetical protein